MFYDPHKYGSNSGTTFPRKESTPGRNMVPTTFSVLRAAFAGLLTTFFFTGVLACPEKCECEELLTAQSTPTGISIDCSRRNLTAVPVYSGPQNVNVSLNLNYNEIAEINIEDFQSYPQIEKLQLGFNKLTSIPEGVSGLTSLVSLSLVENNFGDLTPENAFTKLTRLQTLGLPSCRITSLPDNVFGENLKELSSLDMRANELNAIPVGALKSLNSLTVIMLENNNLRSIETGTFSGMHSLEKVHLALNPIAKIETNAFSHENLRDLQINSCGVSTLMPGALSGLPKLLQLNLRNNRIDDLAGRGIEQLSNLSSLDASINEIGNLPENFFDFLSSIDRVNFALNKMTDFPVSSLAKATQGRKMQGLNLYANPVRCSLKAKIESAVDLESLTFPSDCVADEVTANRTTTPSTPITADNASTKTMASKFNVLLATLAFLIHAISYH